MCTGLHLPWGMQQLAAGQHLSQHPPPPALLTEQSVLTRASEDNARASHLGVVVQLGKELLSAPVTTNLMMMGMKGVGKERPKGEASFETYMQKSCSKLMGLNQG